MGLPGLFTLSPVLPLRLLPCLALVRGAAMNIGVYVAFKIMVFSGSVPRNRIAGS